MAANSSPQEQCQLQNNVIEFTHTLRTKAEPKILIVQVKSISSSFSKRWVRMCRMVGLVQPLEHLLSTELVLSHHSIECKHKQVTAEETNKPSQ